MVCAILVIVSASALPIARYTVKRQKETEKQRDLREMRDAIDRYKDAADQNLIRVEVGTEGYPPDITTLVMGVDLAGPTSWPGGGIGTAAGTLASQSGGFGQGGAGSINLSQAQGLAQAAGLRPRKPARSLEAGRADRRELHCGARRPARQERAAEHSRLRATCVFCARCLWIP